MKPDFTCEKCQKVLANPKKVNETVLKFHCSHCGHINLKANNQ